jgi:hypothetical protein
LATHWNDTPSHAPEVQSESAVQPFPFMHLLHVPDPPQSTSVSPLSF